MADNWYVLNVMPRREAEAAESLTTRGFHVYVPMIKKWRRANKYTQRKQLRSFALMPGYVFLGTTTAWPAWHRVMGARFVRGVLSVDRRPLRIPLKEIDGLVERENDGEFTAWDLERYMRSNREVALGEEAEVVTGPLTGQRVQVVEISAMTAKVLMTMLGDERLVSVGLETLEAVA